MISPARNGSLNSLAGSLRQEIAQRLARAVEIDCLEDARSQAREVLPHGLRPALRRVNGSERTPTPLRFFCMPFEDLLSDAPGRTEKQKGRIARGSVAPIWSWVGQTLLPLETKIYCHNFRTAIVAADHAASKAHAANFRAVAAEAMGRALSSEAGRNIARRILKDDLVFADAEEVALLLEIAPAVMSIHETLVRPTLELTHEHLKALRAIRDRLIVSTPDAAPYVEMIAMNRLAHPSDALKLSLETL